VITLRLDQPTSEHIHSLPIMKSLADLAAGAGRFGMLHKGGSGLEDLETVRASGVSAGMNWGKEVSLEGEHVGESLPMRCPVSL